MLALPQYICTSEGNFEIFIYAFSPFLFPLVLSALKLGSEVELYSPRERMIQRSTERRENFTEFLSRLNKGQQHILEAIATKFLDINGKC